jgi:CHAD domain-containing protein
MSHPALEVVVSVLREQVAELVALSAAVRDDAPEAVHDMRTIVRRMRTTLAAARPVLDRGVTDALRDRLAQLGAALEPARDAEVRAELAETLLETDGGGDEMIRARLVDDAHDEYDRDRRAVVALLDSVSWSELVANLTELVQRPPVGADAYRGQRPVLHRALGRQARRAHRRLGRMDTADLDSIHDARKAVRRVRYLAEAIAQYAPGGRGADVVELGAAAKRLQDVLGDHRDAVLHAAWITSEAEAAERAGQNPEAYRRLERIEQDRAGELESARGPAIEGFERARSALG